MIDCTQRCREAFLIDASPRTASVEEPVDLSSHVAVL